jgi:hypothetical protein
MFFTCVKPLVHTLQNLGPQLTPPCVPHIKLVIVLKGNMNQNYIINYNKKITLLSSCKRVNWISQLTFSCQENL